MNITFVDSVVYGLCPTALWHDACTSPGAPRGEVYELRANFTEKMVEASESERNATLVKTLLGAGWTVSLSVAGWSMRPLLRNRSSVLIAPSTASKALKDSPVTGDVVLFQTSNGRSVIHRVVAADAQSIWTKGDSCAEGDGETPLTRVLGRVVAIEKPFHLPLRLPMTGRLARSIGMFLNRHYPKLVQLKMGARRRLRAALAPGR